MVNRLDGDDRSEANAVLAMSVPVFPQTPCLSQQHKHGKDPEVHASGACLLQVQGKSKGKLAIVESRLFACLGEPI